jgi:hypothetical protein
VPQALEDGGTLHLEANNVRITSDATTPAFGELLIDPSFYFQHAAFPRTRSSPTAGSLTVRRDTLIAPLTENRLLDPGYALKRSGAKPGDLHQHTACCPTSSARRRTSRSLSSQSTALTALPGNLEIGTGSTIRTDSGCDGSRSASDRSLQMNGTIDAPAGTIGSGAPRCQAPRPIRASTPRRVSFLSDDARPASRAGAGDAAPERSEPCAPATCSRPHR